jgi:hypothetical protein
MRMYTWLIALACSCASADRESLFHGVDAGIATDAGAAGAGGWQGEGGYTEVTRSECALSQLNASCSAGWCADDKICRPRAICHADNGLVFPCDYPGLYGITFVTSTGRSYDGCGHGLNPMVTCVPGTRCYVRAPGATAHAIKVFSGTCEN